MFYWIRIYRGALKAAIASMLQYRFAILIWAVWGFVGPLISLAVWSSVSSSSGASITGSSGAQFSRSDFAAYFLTFMVFGHLTMSWDAFEFAFRVRDGNLSPRLLKPIHPIHADIAANLAFKFVTTMMILPAWILLVVLLHPSPPQNFGTLLLAIPALIIAGMLRYMWQYSLALIAFWTTRVEAINQLFFSVDSFMSGRIAPIALMPGWLGAVAYYSPFRGMGSFPVELALGRVQPADILPGFALQFVWLAAGIILFRILWASGIKQYSAVGA
ncbi:MAG: ABC-2 family transporter protein [Chthonomonadales bacterium]